MHEKSKRKQAHINLINLYRRDGELFKSKRDYFISFGAHGKLLKITNISKYKCCISLQILMNNLPMRYNSESAQVKLMIGGNSVIFEDLKISSRFFSFPHGLK